MGDFAIKVGETFRADLMQVGTPTPGRIGELILEPDGGIRYLVKDSITEAIVFEVASWASVISMPPVGPLDDQGRIMLGSVDGVFSFIDHSSGTPVEVGIVTNHVWADVRVAVFPGPTYRLDILAESLGSIFPFFMGDDTVVLGAGDDVFYDYGGNLEMTLGGGHDEAWLYEAQGVTTFKEVYGGAGHDTINYQGGNGEIYGGSGRDVIGPAGGNQGAWTLDGGQGNDTVDGYAGPGTVIVDGDDSGNDVYSGNRDTVLSYAGATGGLVVDMGAARVFGSTTGTDHLASNVGIISRFVGSRAADTMLGGATGDGVVFDGQGGADSLQGSVEGDWLIGRAGADTLVGHQGDDTLDGGVGDDVIIGGEGRDLLRGGVGADVFVYEATTDSTKASAGRDRIMDFDVTQDIIDLSGMDARPRTMANDSFSFIGTAAFTAAGQVRFEHVGSTTVITMNTTGTRGAEMRIDLIGLHALTAESFDL